MAIIGKQWNATLLRVINQDPDNLGSYIEATVLNYTSNTSPEQIEEVYGITADFSSPLSRSDQRSFYLSHTLVPGAYASDEEAMLDTDYISANYALYTYRHRYVGGAWDYATLSNANIDPNTLWDFFPAENPLLSELTVTPFGDYGNGLIHHSFVRRLTRTLEVTGDVDEWTVWPTPPTDEMDGSGDTGDINPLASGIYDLTFIFTPVEGEEGEEVPPDDEGVTDDDLRLRVWPFSLDGHNFAVFRLGPSITLVYDTSTGQWMEWRTPDQDKWRVHVGMNWVGIGQLTSQRQFGSDVVCGDDETGNLYILDPTYGQDDNPTSGAQVFLRTVTGGLSLNGREVAPANALTLDLALGAPTNTSATISLRTSDDMGQSWTEHGSIVMADGNYSQVVEWRALGLMKAPGRLFEISDQGATVRIGRADLR